MTDAEAAGNNLLLAGAALAATVLLVTGLAFLGSSSPWSDDVDPTDRVEGTPVDTDFSTGRVGALVDDHEYGGDPVEAEDAEAVDQEEADELERAVRDSVEDLDEGTVEEATGSGDGSGDGGSEEAREEAVQQVEEDVEDEMQEDVDEETLQNLVDQALRERAGEDGDLGDGDGSIDDGDDTSSSSSPSGGDGTDDAEQGDSTGDTSPAKGSGDEAPADSSTQESPDTPGGGLQSPGFAPSLAVLAAVAALLVVAYRRDALSLEAVRKLPHTIAARASVAAYTIAELASEAIARIREASTPFDAFHAVATLIHRRLGKTFEAEQRSTREMAADIAEGGGAEDGSGGSARQLVMDSWSVLTRASGLDSPDRSTPGQVSRAAVARGLPAEPVRRVTDAFREIEYGDGDPEARAEEVRSAMMEIKDAAGGG